MELPNAAGNEGGSSAQSYITFPKDQYDHFQNCQQSGVWADYLGSSAGAASPFQAINPPADPGVHNFASQEVHFDYTGGLGGNGDSAPAAVPQKKRGNKKAKSATTPSTQARARREKAWPDYGYQQDADGAHVLKPNCSAPEDPEDYSVYVRLCGSCKTYETDQQEGFECNSADVLREWCWEQDNGYAFLLGYWGRKDHRPGQQGLSRAEYLRPFAAEAARRSGVCRTLKNWVTHIGKMESDFRKAKNLWTGAGEEPANQLNGEGEWQTLHQQRLNICPEWDEYVQMGAASMAKFGGGHTGESSMPCSESDDNSDTTESTMAESEAGSGPTPSEKTKKRKRKQKTKSAADVEVPPGLATEQGEYEDQKKREENRNRMGRSDADILKDISAMESAAVQEKADKLLAAKKAEAELALQTRNNATQIKYAFKEKELSHAKAMDLKAHERQMSIDEGKEKRELLKLQFDMLKELTANHEKEEEKKVERIISLRENNMWDGLSDQHKEKLMIREPAPTMQTVRDLMNM
jgi:hypothetical protein